MTLPQQDRSTLNLHRSWKGCRDIVNLIIRILTWRSTIQRAECETFMFMNLIYNQSLLPLITGIEYFVITISQCFLSNVITKVLRFVPDLPLSWIAVPTVTFHVLLGVLLLLFNLVLDCIPYMFNLYFL